MVSKSAIIHFSTFYMCKCFVSRLLTSLLICHLTAFETFLCGSWQTVERLRIRDGAINMHVVGNGEIVEENIPMSTLRIRSRKATLSDCTCLLRPGIDICVLTTSKHREHNVGDPITSSAYVDENLQLISDVSHLSDR